MCRIHHSLSLWEGSPRQKCVRFMEVIRQPCLKVTWAGLFALPLAPVPIRAMFTLMNSGMTLPARPSVYYLKSSCTSSIYLHIPLYMQPARSVKTTNLTVAPPRWKPSVVLHALKTEPKPLSMAHRPRCQSPPCASLLAFTPPRQCLCPALYPERFSPANS